MLRSGVTTGCAAAMVMALFLAVRLRHTRRTPSPLTGTEPFGERLSVTVGRAAGMLLGASLAGLLTIGAGSRLMMRVLAITSPDRVQGLRTEADEVIGRVSTGGTTFLIVVAGIGAGAAGLVLFLVLRRWLPDRSLIAGLVGVAIGAGLLVRPLGFIASDNTDFALVEPLALAVGLCLAMIVLFGATFGVLVDRLAPQWPRPGWSVHGVVSVLPFGLLLPAPLLFIAAIVGVLVATFAQRVRPMAVVDGEVQPSVERAGTLGRILVAAFGVLGGLSVVAAAGQVLVM